jgi:hypothetical protein
MPKEKLFGISSNISLFLAKAVDTARADSGCVKVSCEQATMWRRERGERGPAFAEANLEKKKTSDLQKCSLARSLAREFVFRCQRFLQEGGPWVPKQTFIQRDQGVQSVSDQGGEGKESKLK